MHLVLVLMYRLILEKLAMIPSHESRTHMGLLRYYTKHMGGDPGLVPDPNRPGGHLLYPGSGPPPPLRSAGIPDTRSSCLVTCH
jgi:hypothetical protein